MKETITATKRIFEGRVVTLDILDVELPDGQTSVREVVQHPGAVAIVALDEAQRVLLVKQYRIAADQVMLEVPAGTLEPDEDPRVCADRELREEASYTAEKLEAIGGIYTAPGYTSEYIHLFLATQLTESSLPMDTDEFIEVEWLPLKDALAKIDSGEINDSKTVTGLLRVAGKLQG